MNLYNEQYLIDNLAQAFLQARTAVNFDQQGQYDAAHDAYRRTITMLQAQQNMVPQQYQPLLIQNVQKYEQRCSTLVQWANQNQSTQLRASMSIQETQRPAPQSSPRPMPAPQRSHSISSIERPERPASTADARPPSPHTVGPSSQPQREKSEQLGWTEDLSIGQKQPVLMPRERAEERALWFMSSLFESMNSGSYVNKRFYIPPQVWWQSGVKFSNMQAKTQFLEGLLPVIAKVQEAFASNAVLDLKADLDPLQAKLAKAGVSGIKSPAVAGKEPTRGSKAGDEGSVSAASGGKNFKSFFANKAGVIAGKFDFKSSFVYALTLYRSGSEEEAYLMLLKKTFEAVTFLNKYAQFFQDSSNTKGLATIKTIGEFLNQTLLTFAIMDLHSLAERYIKKGKDDFFG